MKKQPDKDSENRIERVINNLLPATSFDGRYASGKTLQERQAFYHTPGVSLAVINNYEIEWARGFGICEADTTRPITTSTIFQAGSISKPVFALAILRLVQEGRLSLDEDINTYLTSWHIPANHGWQPRLTLRHILSHSAGLTVGGFPGYQATEAVPGLVQVLNGEPPANTPGIEVNILPGLQYRYSGGGTTVAQQLIMDVLGEPFPEIMRHYVLDPLGMVDSTYEQPLPVSWSTRAATAHPWKSIPLIGKYHTYPEMAAAGLWTTPTDLARLGVELLKVLQDRKNPMVVSKDTLEAMLLPQLADLKTGQGQYCGLGFFCDGKEDDFSFGHGGWDEGFVAILKLYKNTGQGAVIMLNSNEGSPMLDELLRAIGVEYGWPKALVEPKAEIGLANLMSYTGTYQSKTGIKFKVSGQKDGLALEFDNQPPLPIAPSSVKEFFSKVTNTTIIFKKGRKGIIKSMTLIQSGKEIVAEKV